MKKVLILGLAVLAIAFGLFGLAGNLANNSNPQAVEAKPKLEQKNLVVWQLSQAALKGQRVERSHFKVLKLTEAQANALGVLADMKLDIPSGAVYRRDVKVGDVAFKDLMITPDSDDYLDLVISANRVPYAIKVSPSSVVGGVINHGSYIDILALSLPSDHSLEAMDASVSRKRSMFVTPVLTHIKVLKVDKKELPERRGEAPTIEVNLVLELTRKQVATLTVAQRIAEIEVHKSIGEYQKSDLHADAGDVLSNFKSIVEYRAEAVTIN
ncbi:MAG: Flp pilus assembly protein CpaB [Shewanella sp.]|nr:Flp pilus assembly protein CpaB [Shewanella sp.]MCF1430171.1 Flp pilus assembly protein CpaB [Shewanella sp.]MCF1456249.1 Flp pilus assembly protein CpaB [Shewanella sp.]